MKNIFKLFVICFAFFQYETVWGSRVAALSENSPSKEISTQKKILLAVVPQATTKETYNLWIPLVSHLEKKLKIDIEFIFFNNIVEFEKGVIKKQPDLVFMNPYHLLIFQTQVKYIPIIRSSKGLVGVLVVPIDSSYKTVQELNNTSISFPAPNAFAASLYMRALLEKKEKIKFKPIYSGNHSNAYRSVLFGKTQAAGGVKKTLLNEKEGVQKNLKILYQTVPTASHPLAVHSRIDQKMRLEIQSEILNYSKTNEGKKIVDELFADPVIPDFNKDYKTLKDLRINDYVVSEDK